MTVGNWIAIVALIVTAISASFTAANYLAGRRERRRSGGEIPASVKATINATSHEHGWRSAQLHIVPLDENQRDFPYKNWRIERVRLLKPRDALLARAEDDDYATGVFHPDQPVRVLEGKADGRPQQYAIEFFIKSHGEEAGRKAVFKVTFSRVGRRWRRTAVVTALMPADCGSALSSANGDPPPTCP